MTLAEIQERFPKARFAPHADCPYCHGSGVKTVKTREYACECLFISQELMDVFHDASRSAVEKWGKE